MSKYLTYIVIIFFTPLLSAKDIGVLITATGKYSVFVSPLIDSARKYFCKDHNVTYFVFTDGEIPEASDVVRTEQKRLGWPFDTMLRYEVYYKNRHKFLDQDYIFAVDADMLFVGDVGDEILSDLVATIHPGFYNKRGSYETRKKSKAYVAPSEGDRYFAGGFYGGQTSKILEMFRTNLDHIYDDLERGIIAVWHDESHWNRYCIDHPPTKNLSPSYCYPESWDIPFERKLLALDKNHAEFRK